MIEETDCTRKLSKYFRIFTICGTFRTKNPLAKHDHCIYYAQLFWSVPCIYLRFPGEQKGEISKCMLNVSLDILMEFLIWMYFSSILRCFHLKVILHGFVHFAWMFGCFFIWTLFSKSLKGPPTSIVFWVTCYLTPPHQWSFWKINWGKSIT